MARDLFEEAGIVMAPAAKQGGRDLFEEFGVAAPAPEKPERSVAGFIADMGIAAWQGAKSTGRMVGAAGNTFTGDLRDVEDYALRQQLAQEERPEAAKALTGEIERRKKANPEGGLIDAIRDVGGAMIGNPEGSAQLVAEQAPNAAVALGSGLAGAKLGAAGGSLLGPAGAAVGGIGGFLGGMFLGNTLLETGGKAIEKSEGGFTDAERGEAILEGAVKGGVITAVDAATLGAGGLVARSLGKAAINAGARAEAQVLADAGVDLTNRAAIEIALAGNPALRQAAQTAGVAASKAASTTGSKVAMAGTGLTMETVGEGTGEYLGELAATGKADVYDAVLESAAGFSQSVPETAWNMRQARGNDLNARNIQRQGAGLRGAPPATLPATDQPQARPTLSAETVQATAQARLDALERKANGTPEQTVVGPDGASLVVPGEQPQYLNLEERRERTFLRENLGEPQRLADGLGVTVGTAATPEARLVELDLLSQVRGLSEPERAEFDALLAQFDQEDADGGDGAVPPMDPGADGSGAADDAAGMGAGVGVDGRPEPGVVGSGPAAGTGGEAVPPGRDAERAAVAPTATAVPDTATAVQATAPAAPGAPTEVASAPTEVASAPAAQPAPITREAKLPLGSTVYDRQGNPWRVQNRRSGILTLQPIVDGRPDTKAAQRFVIDQDKAPAGSGARVEPLFLQAPAQGPQAQPAAGEPVAPPLAGKEARERRAARGHFASQQNYQIDSEDRGSFGVTVRRLKDGGVLIDDDGQFIEYNADFARGKSDEEILRYSFEPVGFRGARQSNAAPVDVSPSAQNSNTSAEPVQIPAENEQVGGGGGARPVVLQNRDRSGVASVTQMQSIAANPDPRRLSFSRDFGSGAPVVFSNFDEARLVDAQLGREDTITDSQGRQYAIQYAVIEADEVVASNAADGTPNDLYEDSATPGLIRAVAGNGRMAGLQEAFRRGTAAGYAQGIAADTALHGIDPAVIDAMSSPVLVRIMRSDDVTPDIGDRSNVSGAARLNPVEQARTDVARVNLDALDFSESGDPTPAAVKAFVSAMPEAERSELMTRDGAAGRQAIDRLMAATFAKAYGDERLVELYAQATDPDARNVLSAMAQAAGAMAKLEGMGDLDVRPLVIDAANMAVNAARNGVSLAKFAQTPDITLAPEVRPIAETLATNARSAKRMAESLRALADLAYSEATKESADMFGEVPRRTRGQVIEEVFGGQGREGGAGTVQNAGRAGMDEAGAAGQGDAPGQREPAGDTGQPQGQGSDRPADGQDDAFGLTSYSLDELAQRNAELEQAQADRQTEQDRRASAPPADDFVLSGSDRPADQAAARGQMELGEAPVDAAAAQAATSPKNDTTAPAQEQAGVPMFATYADAQAWIKERSKALGGKGKFTASDEYKQVFPQIKALYDAENAASAEAAMKRLTDAGMKVGDRVRMVIPGMFLSSGRSVMGTIIDRGGFPVVKIDGEMDVSSKGRIQTVKSIAWDARWKKDEQRINSSGEPIGRDGKAESDRARQRMDVASTELAGQIAENAQDEDFDAAELPGVIRSWADESRVPADELRQEVIRRLRANKELKAALKKQVERALDPTRKALESAAPAGSKPTGPIEDVGEKIGGARKDTSTPTGPRGTKQADDRPGWRKRYSVSQIAASSRLSEVGRWTIHDERVKDRLGQAKQVGRDSYATKEEAEAAIPLAEVARNHRAAPASTKQGESTVYEIVRDVTDRKRVKVVDQQFATREDALRYMIEHAVEIIETKTSFGEEILPTPETVMRKGAPRRTADAVGEDFQRAFGFRGVEFGNWNNQAERQEVMNHAYDGLMDLAEVLGIPPKAIGLDGELALAFGARGSGLSGARAHYEPDYAVINLTKMHGAGSLAHEWLHAVDHYFARQDGKAKSARVKNRRGDDVFPVQGTEQAMASHGFGYKSAVRQEVRDAYKAVIETMYRKAEQFVEDTQRADRFVANARKDVQTRLDSIRQDLAEQKDPRYWKRKNAPASAEQLAAFDELSRKIVDGEMLETTLVPVRSATTRKTLGSMRWSNDALERISAILKDVRGRGGFDSTNKSGVLDHLRQEMGNYSQRLKMLADAQSAEVKSRKVPTEYAMAAKSIDQGRASDYWSTPHEMAARAFQSYVLDKIAEQGGASDFLTYGPENVVVPTPWGWKRPFPAGAERKAINAAFDAMFATIETRETDSGVAMFSRGGAVQGLSTDATSTIAAAVRKAWANGPEVVVVAGMQDPLVPQEVRDYDAQQRSRGATGEPEGFFYGGKVYLVAGQLATPADVVRVLSHEALGHYGLRGLFGDRLAGILDQIGLVRRTEVMAKLQEYGLPDTTAGRRVAAEEVLSVMAQTNPQLGFVRRAVAAIRTWLRGLGLDLRMTDDEIIRSFILPARQWVQRGGARPAAGEVSMSRGEPVHAEIDEDTEALLEEFGLPVESREDAQRALAAGDRVFVAAEMDEQAIEVLSVRGLEGYTPDQMLVLRRSDIGESGVSPDDALMQEVERQFSQTERAYGGREAYNRARAAGRTKLGYRQWVQVRTPAFKAWFGDWGAVLAQKRLDAMKPLEVRVPPEWRGLSGAELRAKMAQELDRMVRQKVVISHPDLGEIRVGRVGAKKTEGTARDPAKALVAADIEALIPASIYARSEPSRGGDGPDIDGYSTLLARVSLDGVPLIAAFTARHQSDGRWYYNAVTLHDTQEKARDSYGRPDQLSTDADSSVAPIAGLKEFSRQPLRRVNPNTVSKVTDPETGEPRVVYHGTKARFSAFDSRHARGLRRGAEGFYFTRHADDASGYAANGPADGANVMPAYIMLKSPYRTDGLDYEHTILSPARVAELEADGYDGMIVGDFDEIIAFRSTQIKSVFNRGTYSSENPDIGFSRSTLGDTPPPSTPPANRWQRLKARAMDLTSPEALDKLIYELQDKFIDLKRIRDHIAALGGTVNDLNDAYLGEELYHKRLAKRTQDFLNDEVKPLLAELRATGTSIQDFERFLHARHAPEANRVLAERNPNQEMIDARRAQLAADVRQLELDLQRATARGTATKAIEQALDTAREQQRVWGRAQAFRGTEAERNALSGMSDGEAQALMDGLPPGRRQVLESLAARVDAINGKTLDALQSYGLMDKASLDAWRATYQFYVPLHRDEAHADSGAHPIGQGYSSKGDAAKRRTGSTEQVTNILSHVVMQREAALTRGEKARVGKQLYLLAAQNPDPSLWQVDKPPKIRRVDEATGTVVTMVDPLYKQKPNVLMVRIGGKDAAIVFNERNPQAMRLAEALRNLDVGDLHFLVGMVAKGTRWFASVNTQYNPIFGLINFARDLGAGVLNLSTTPLAGKERQVARDTFPAMRAIYRDTRGKAPANEQWARLWQQMQDDGGTTGYRDLFADADERAKKLQRELGALDRGQASKAAHAVLDWLSAYNETMENAVRLAAYKEALDMGMSRPRAASLAKNLTVNFNRKGRQTREAGAFYVFFNAAIQGNTRMFQTLLGPAGKKIMLGGVMLGAINTLLGMAVMGGGDEDEWEKIPEFIKERSIIIPVGRQDYVTIPMPLGFHVLPNIGRTAVEMMLGDPDKTPGKMVGKLLMTLAEAFNPLGSSQDLAQMAAPTVIDPVVALMQNRDWTGKPIYRPDYNSLDPTPGPQRAKDTASTPSRVIAELLNMATGGTDYRPGAISWTPDQIDYVFGQLTGGIGRELLKLNQTVVAPITGEELPAYKIPLVGRIYGNTRGPSAQSERFYENVRELNEIENELRGRAKAGQDVQEVLREEPLARLIGVGNAAEQQIRRLREQRRAVSERAEPGYRNEVAEINERIGGVMAVLNRQVREAKRAEAVE